ncbi:amidohydrolase [Marinigracilibium pacificum]|uniref:Amidohydrolase n=1 Tax=Marinigracilibium pacificum TaxID=2729599 RepID=A0A848J4L3_9BACT|nr:amidohydrolase [Marinigracilibium pacificum]NMM50701.1 amidohydrolase [Marinigracilibium pacificum]
MRNKYIILYRTIFLLTLTVCFSCSSPKEADLIVHNGIIYTVDEDFSTVEAMAIKDGKIIETGNSIDILANYKSESTTDLEGKSVVPGLIDGHAHFFRYGLGLVNADLTGTSSKTEILERLVAHRESYPNNPWIIGRGWDQNDWEEKEFPSRLDLDSLFPDVPVYLIRIDGHAAWVNTAAISQADITPDNSEIKVDGGDILRNEDGIQGIFVDNAMDLINRHIPDASEVQQKEALFQAQKNCFEVGLTTVVDAGLDKETIDLIDEMQKSDYLKIRIYAMLNPTPSNKEYYFKNGPYFTDFLTVTSFKIYSDGALGSRGACLIEPYADKPDQTGFLLQNIEYFDETAKEMLKYGFQMNTHCIGDSSNRALLNIYAKCLEPGNNKRWRIEHAQIINESDLSTFGEYNIIPSVQPTHATSDMYWADERLGDERIKDAYIFKELLDQNGYIALGSDFPVEDINPLLGFYAAVARKDLKGYPDSGFQKENALTREETLRGMTIWAAKANFEEEKKGSLEKGKFADFIVLEKDIMKIPEDEIPGTKVLQTYVGGEQVYNRK